MTTAYTVTLLENCRVSPPPAAVADTSLPLTFLDIIWLTYHQMTRVLFYDCPCSKTNFTQTVVPNLKNSLSLVLKHFSPLAGNLITPSSISTTNLQIRYSDGDYVSLTFAECTDNDYNHLSKNHSRDADILLPLVPQLPPASSEGDCVVTPLLAIQVTLFPNHGLCIGFASSHVVADGSSMFNFIRTWASIAKQINSNIDDNYDALLLEGLPFYDRSVIQDPKGLGTLFRTVFEGATELRQQGNENHDQSVTANKIRATFILGQSNIQVLKNLVSAQRPTLAHVSSFTVACAYLWTCIAKTRPATGEGAHHADERQHFIFPMECRARLDPPIPATYFGNCLVPCLTTLKTTQLVGEQGLVTAAELIGKVIHSRVQGGVLSDADKWFVELAGVSKGEWKMGVAGSPNLDYYKKIDFGWGKPKKFEFVEELLSLSRCKDSTGDLEIGLIMPKNEMDLFSTIFTQGLIN